MKRTIVDLHSIRMTNPGISGNKPKWNKDYFYFKVYIIEIISSFSNASLIFHENTTRTDRSVLTVLMPRNFFTFLFFKICESSYM